MSINGHQAIAEIFYILLVTASSKLFLIIPGDNNRGIINIHRFLSIDIQQ